MKRVSNKAFTQDQSRPKRWRKAIIRAKVQIHKLIDIQSEYRAWLDMYPANPAETEVIARLEEVTAFNFDEMLDILDDAQYIDLPLGYGRD